MKLSKAVLILFLCLMACMVVVPASAETLTGTLGSSEWNSTNYDRYSSSATLRYNFVFFEDIEKSAGLISLIRFTKVQKDTFDTDAPSGAQTSVIFRETNGTVNGSGYATDTQGRIIGTGIIGYQRLYDNAAPPVEQLNGYFWATMSSWNLSTYNGSKRVYMEYNRNALYNITAHDKAGFGGMPIESGLGYFEYSTDGIGGYYTMNKVSDVLQTFSATKPGGIGINGSVEKLGSYSKIFISNLYHNTLISEPIHNTNTFNFTTNATQIYISALSVNNNWYNSSLLFLAGTPTPTPTPTPTVTPPPGGTFTATIYVKDNFNNTALANTYVELHRNDAGGSTNTGYTNASGIIEFAEQPYPTYATGYSNEEMRFWKTGYAYGSFTFDPIVMGSFSYTMYLNPSITSNPATVNVTVHAIDASNGNANLANALVKVYPNAPSTDGSINWDYYLSGYTNASGLITFNNVPASAFHEIVTTKTLYSTDTYGSGMLPLTDFTHNAYLTTIGVTPTPTQLPVSGNYSLAVSTNAVQVYGNITATISSTADPTLADLIGITYYYSDSESVETDFYEAGSTNLQKAYWLYGGTWYEFDQNTQDYSHSLAGIPNPDTLQFRGSVGTKTLHCVVFTGSGPYYDLTTTVVVGAGQNYVNTFFYAIDGDTGAQIQGPEIDIYNKNSHTWTNGTYATGQVYISSPQNILFDAYGHLAGYIDPAIKLNVSSGTGGNMYRIPFYLGTSPSAGNQTFHFIVTDQTDTPISGASVLVKESGNSTGTVVKTTDGGIAEFTLKQSTLYTYVVSKTGYISVSGSRTTSAASADSVYIQLRTGTQPTATITTTPTQTVIPTGTGGNYTGFWGPFANGIQGAGASPTEIPLLLGAMIIVIGTIVGGWGSAAYTPNPAFSLMGAAGGAILGFIGATAFGFISFIYVVAIVLVGILVFIFFSH